MPPRKTKTTGSERPVLFDAYKAVWHVKPHRKVVGDRENPIDAETAKLLLKWEEEVPGGPKFGNDYLLTDRYGKKVRCGNNIRNRPLYSTNVEDRVQDILRLRWELNGEPVIIGQTGIDLNGQHTLIAVVLAQQELDRHPELWGDNFPDGKVSIEKLVVYGIEEADRVVNTMDTCRPRSIADVIYRNPFFAKMDAKNRANASRWLDHAIRSMWRRTGVTLPGGTYSLIRTHPEAIAFAESHKKLLQCVKHILEANSEGRVQAFVGPGYAAAACYLMGSSSTPGEDYYGPEEHTEKPLKWDNWDKACEFWDEFAKPTTDITDDDTGKVTPASALAPLHKAIVALTRDDGSPGSQSEKDYLIAQAWDKWLSKGKVTAKDLGIKWSSPDDKGRKHPIDAPNLGGIDLGLSYVVPKAADDPEPSEEEANGHAEEAEEIANGHDKEPVEEGSTDWSWLEKLHADSPDVDVVFAKNALGKWAAWDVDGNRVAAEIGLKEMMHPKGRTCVTVTDNEVDGIAHSLNAAGMVVGMAEEVDGEWEIVTVYKPDTTKKKGGKSK